jgi:hypothetical protein
MGSMIAMTIMGTVQRTKRLASSGLFDLACSTFAVAAIRGRHTIKLQKTLHPGVLCEWGMSGTIAKP